MTRTQYRQTRRLIRDNGRAALSWIQGDARVEWDVLLFNIQDAKDLLAERQDIATYCKRSGFAYTFRHLAN